MSKVKFPKPAFSELKSDYRTHSKGMHACSVFDLTDGAVNTCAGRMSEALVIANRIVPTPPPTHPDLPWIEAAYLFGTPKFALDRSAIAALGNGKGDGKGYLLGKYGYGDYANVGKLCPHGIGRGAADLGAFLKYHWGPRTLGWTAQASKDSAPSNILGKQGVIAFLKIPGFDGQGHIDLWDDKGPVGDQYWNAETMWLWELS